MARGAKKMLGKSTNAPRGRPFVKGDKRAGRPRGVPNKVTIEIRELSRGLLSDPAYLATLKQRLKKGTLAPAVWCLLYHYAYGKPKETVEVGGAGGGPIEHAVKVLFVEPVAPAPDSGE